MEKGIPGDMYREHMLELYRNPQNFGVLKNATHEKTEYNSLCGDEITVQLLVKNDVVRDVKFNGSGCVISLVSASLLTEKLKGMEKDKVMEIEKKDVLDLLGVKITSARIKCVMLALDAVKGALK